jgi:hypothetical protein
MDAEILRQDAELLRRGDLDWTLLNDGELCPEQFRADRLERHQELMCRVREAHRVLGEAEACRCRLLDRYDSFTRGACPLYDDADPWDRGDEEMRRFSSAFARAKTEEAQARATIAILYAGAVEAAAIEDRQDLEARTATHVAEAAATAECMTVELAIQAEQHRLGMSGHRPLLLSQWRRPKVLPSGRLAVANTATLRRCSQGVQSGGRRCGDDCLRPRRV